LIQSEPPLETDETLMLRFGRGDAAAFEALYRRHEAPVFRYLLRSVRNEAAANDLLQEVWFAVARSADRYQPTAKFTTWLYTIAHNKMVDAIRASRPTESLEIAADFADDAVIDKMPAADARWEPVNVLQARDQAQALVRAVEQLPAEQRSAFLLQAEADMSVDDIAAATGASFETTKSRLRYARTKLRRLLWEFA
jgi:RNA polymerase sigma factor (sigma-70 family)